ncbi:branched-chain amino acid transport system II carrier protein [Metabacillus fastidiosus]
MNSLSMKQIMAVGLMLFALFFGAGNMIFPPLLGQEAGTNTVTAIIGFLITGIGLPLLGVLAVAKTGDVQTMASRVHPVYGVIFTVVLYLVIGPFFAIPRTGTVSYEIGVLPFLSESASRSQLPLVIFAIIFFTVTAWLAMNPSKLVDRIGKILTPALLIILSVLVVKSVLTPLGKPQSPAVAYTDDPFFKGFIDGYLTMDTLAALVFGIIVISSIKELNITNGKMITKICIQAGIIAAAGLAIVYIALAFIGATSPEAIGVQENGGAILSGAAKHLFGPFGSIILALTIFFACLTTSVGLVSSCAKYFSQLIPAFSYKVVVITFSVFSTVIANVGLTQLIAFSVPVLIFLYPLAIVLILLSFFHKVFNGYSLVYIGALIPTGLISLVDGLKEAKLNVSTLVDALSFLPLFAEGIGWITPAIAGAVVGYFIALITVGHTKQ